MKQLIYIAGAYRGDTTYQTYLNIRRAEEVAIKTWRNGDFALTPHLNTQLFDMIDGLSPDIFLEGGLEMLSRCDKVLMMRGWEKSAGSVVEHKVAQDLGIPIIYEE